GRMDVYGLQSLVARSMIEAGEAFVRFRVAPDMTVPLQLQILDPDQVDRGLHRDLDGGGRIRAGVEFDGAGRRVAYHVFPDPPGDMLARALAPVRVPATELLHIFEPLAAGQVRGVSWFAPTLLRLREIDEVMDATLLGQKIRAMLAGFVIDANGEAGGFAGTATAGAPSDVLEHGLEPGTLRILPPGTDIRFSDPAKGGSDYHHFLQAELRAVAAGLGVTYEQLTGDMTGVNFSSARVALIEFRRRVSAIQHQVLVQQFIRPVWQRFVRLAVLAGAVDAPGFAFDPEPWLAARFMPPAWDYVNPFQDVQADAAALEAGLKSRSEIIAARGRDPERVDAEIAADMARAARLGLSVARPRSPASFEKEPEDA
ncbi:MAG: phage portal protein, partial [Inquilinaceae bacterium]